MENFVPEITPKLLLMADTLREARGRRETQQDKVKEDVDKHRRPGPSYITGDKVLLETHTLSKANEGISSKLAPRYDGPHTIKKKVGSCSYVIAKNDGSEIVYREKNTANQAWYSHEVLAESMLCSFSRVFKQNLHYLQA